MSEVNNEYELFFNKFIILENGCKTKSSDIGKCFNEFNKGNGKNKLFSYLKEVKFIKKSKSNEFLNIRLNVKCDKVKCEEFVCSKCKDEDEDDKVKCEEFVCNKCKDFELLELEIEIRHQNNIIDDGFRLMRFKNELEFKAIELDINKFKFISKMELSKVELVKEQTEIKYKIEEREINSLCSISKAKTQYSKITDLKEFELEKKIIELNEIKSKLRHYYECKINNRYDTVTINIINKYDNCNNEILFNGTLNEFYDKIKNLDNDIVKRLYNTTKDDLNKLIDSYKYDI